MHRRRSALCTPKREPDFMGYLLLILEVEIMKHVRAVKLWQYTLSQCQNLAVFSLVLLYLQDLARLIKKP